MSDVAKSPAQLKRFLVILAGLVATLAAIYLLRGLNEAPYGLTERAEARPYLGMPAEPVFTRAGNWTTEAAFPNLTFRNPVFLEPEPGSQRLLVGELEGRLYAIDGSSPETDRKELVLDLSNQTQGGWDSGMLGLAYHPEYDRVGSPNRGFIYIFYSWSDDPVIGRRPVPEKITWSRLSRFTVDPATGVADRASETVLMDQRDVNIWHAGGGLFFHPADGFLYVSVGDEGGARDFRGNSQKIDKSLFAGVLRIDVDRRGGTISHPIRKQPVDGRTDHYYIPSDNPFVGVPDALEEFYAIGLRSPHRMTYDPVDNLAWIGDIGQSAMEEVSVLEFDRGPLNFQWSILEGTREGFADAKTGEGTRGIWTDPIWEFGRDQGRSIIGGYVYRGQRHPALRGKYIVGDFASGRIWALSYIKGAPPQLDGVELLAQLTSLGYNYRGGEGGLTSFGRTHDGELFLLFHGMYTKIARLTDSEAHPGNIPTLLSQTGVFTDLGSLEPVPGMVPYDVNVAQWTDGVPARRWISVPTGKSIGFDPEGQWKLPPGTVLVQHFEAPAPASATDPALATEPAQRLETRLLVGAADGSFYAVAYRWNADGSDAELVTAEASQSYRVTPVDGGPRQKSWAYVRTESCMECHSQEAGYVLGMKSRQLNREFAYPSGISDQQIRSWGHVGLFEPEPGRKVMAGLDRLAPPDDETQSLEHRVRSYLDANCAHCHGAKAVRSAWNGNFSVPLTEQGVLFGPVLGDVMSDGHHVIAPGDVAGSVLHRRAASDDLMERMPPLGSQGANPAFLGLLREWIEALPREENTPPNLVRARQTGDTTIDVVFTEAVRAGIEAGGSERPENYGLPAGTQVLSAVLQTDGRTVTLTTTPLPAGQALVLTVSDVADRAVTPNRIAPGTSVTVQK